MRRAAGVVALVTLSTVVAAPAQAGTRRAQDVQEITAQGRAGTDFKYVDWRSLILK